MVSRLVCAAIEPKRRESVMANKYIVRHGVMRHLGEFDSAEGTTWTRGDQVVVRTDRGQETGEVLCAATQTALELIPEPTRGQFVRPMTEEDGAVVERLRETERREFETCCRLIAHRQLPMELV